MPKKNKVSCHMIIFIYTWDIDNVFAIWVQEKSRILSNKGISNGRNEVFEPEDDLFKEMAMKEEQEDKQEEE